MAETIVKTGQTVPLKIKRLGINGEGIGYFKRLIIFVPYALPKEEVLVKITKATPRYAEGELIKVKKTSKDRVVAPCPVYYECGGCQLQHLAYQAQLDFKRICFCKHWKNSNQQAFDLINFCRRSGWMSLGIIETKHNFSYEKISRLKKLKLVYTKQTLIS